MYPLKNLLRHCACTLLLFSMIGAMATQAQEYESFKAQNRVTIEYTILLPDGYDGSNDYPTAVAFAGAAAWEKEANEMIHTVWSDTAFLNEWIVVVPLTPGEDWRTHPNHHALNDLMDLVKEEYSVRGDTFHILGVGQAGVDIASTWGGMSNEYFSSLIAVNGTPFQSWDDKDFKSFASGDGKDQNYLIISTSDAAEGDNSLASFYALLESVDQDIVVQ